METSTDGKTWTTFVAGTDEIILENAGDKVYFRAGEGGNSKFASNPSTNYWRFNITRGQTAASGNIMSLINGTEETTTLQATAFASLFDSNIYLTEPPDLPATTCSGGNVYSYMFYGCYRLVRTAKIPNLIQITGVFGANMYSKCSGISDVDMSGISFSGTIASSGIGTAVFQNCTGLKTIKPAEVRVGSSMFKGCTSLEVVDYRHATSVITLSNINAFSSTNSTYKIVVPDSLYSSWITTTNWKDSSIVGHIVKASDYVEA